MRHSEADRKAFNEDRKEQAEAQRIAKALAADPSIGQLNNGKFYRIENGEVVYITI